jgi:hypothetical protein
MRLDTLTAEICMGLKLSGVFCAATQLFLRNTNPALPIKIYYYGELFNQLLTILSRWFFLQNT